MTGPRGEIRERLVSGDSLRIPVSDLTTFIVDVLQAVGVPWRDGAIVAECLLAANLSGIDSHGVVRLAHYVRRLCNGSINARPNIRFERASVAVGYLDGGDGLGHVAGHCATSKVMELAGEAGAGAVSVGNSSHFGMAGYYALRLAEKGFIGMCMTPTDRLLVPYGASRPFFGSNPICFGFPMDGGPVVVDMATTTIPYGKVALAAIENRMIPDDWGVDADGNATNDPNQVVGLHPASGPKGSGLAMAVDIFGSLLAGMPWGPHINRMYGDLDSPRRLGHFFAAWDVRRLMPLDRFKRSLREMCSELNSQAPAPSFKRVCYPGQLESERRDLHAAKGIALDSGLYDELAELGRSVNVTFDCGRRDAIACDGPRLRDSTK